MDQQTPLDFLIRILNRKTQRDSLKKDLIKFSESDWDQLIQFSRHKHATLILYERLITLHLADLVPKPTLETLHNDYLQATGRNMLMLHQANLILKALQSHNIEVIALKGIYLIEAIYSKIGYRTFIDIDIMIRKSDIPLALKTMQGLGYEMTTYYDSEETNLDIKHIPPLQKPNQPLVEIHWTILEENEPFNINSQGMWQRAIPETVAGNQILALGLEDLILHLCIHLTYQHRLKIGFKALYDIAAIIEKYHAQIDSTELVSIAQDWGVERVIYVTLYLLESILGIDLPNDILYKLVADPIEITILQEAERQFLLRTHSKVSLTPDLVTFQSANSLESKFKLLLHRVFLPKHTLARLYSVPPNSPKIYLYYPVRFWQLLRNYAPTLWKVYKRDADTSAEIDSEEKNLKLRKWLAGNHVDFS